MREAAGVSRRKCASMCVIAMRAVAVAEVFVRPSGNSHGGSERSTRDARNARKAYGGGGTAGNGGTAPPPSEAVGVVRAPLSHSRSLAAWSWARSQVSGFLSSPSTHTSRASYLKVMARGIRAGAALWLGMLPVAPP